MTLHTTLSYLKSVMRIVGYSFLPTHLMLAIVWLIFAEITGIIEEFPGMYKGTKT
jgi:hypothetical protein